MLQQLGHPARVVMVNLKTLLDKQETNLTLIDSQLKNFKAYLWKRKHLTQKDVCNMMKEGTRGKEFGKQVGESKQADFIKWEEKQLFLILGYKNKVEF